SKAGGRSIARLAVRRAERNLGQPVHTLAPGSPRRAWLVGRRSQTASSVAEDQRAVVQAAVLLAGVVPDLFPGRAEGERDLSAQPSEADRDRAARVDSDSFDGAGCYLALGRSRRGGARVYHPRLLRISHRLHAQSPGPALRHRSDG